MRGLLVETPINGSLLYFLFRQKAVYVIPSTAIIDDEDENLTGEIVRNDRGEVVAYYDNQPVLNLSLNSIDYETHALPRRVFAFSPSLVCRCRGLFRARA